MEGIERVLTGTVKVYPAVNLYRTGKKALKAGCLQIGLCEAGRIQALTFARV
jgi:hypothetical protein